MAERGRAVRVVVILAAKQFYLVPHVPAVPTTEPEICRLVIAARATREGNARAAIHPGDPHHCLVDTSRQGRGPRRVDGGGVGRRRPAFPDGELIAGGLGTVSHAGGGGREFLGAVESGDVGSGPGSGSGRGRHGGAPSNMLPLTKLPERLEARVPSTGPAPAVDREDAAGPRRGAPPGPRRAWHFLNRSIAGTRRGEPNGRGVTPPGGPIDRGRSCW